MIKIPFNRPYITGKEIKYITKSFELGKLSGDGFFTKKCHEFFEKRFELKKVLLTTSCTHALEMAALLLNIKEGDEVIMPSYTFVSTANAFALRGAKIIFADSGTDNPNIDIDKLESLITKRTKVIVPVHYAGISCNMDLIVDLAKNYGLDIVEDAAQAIDSFYNGKPLGTFGVFSAFSFHETKNIISGEGGLLGINEPAFNERSEIVREKGTNRSKFFRGEVDKYGWVEMGSSYLPSEIIAAFLYAQLEELDKIQNQRKRLWNLYYNYLSDWAEKFGLQLPIIPPYATNNGHMFYIVFRSIEERTRVIQALKNENILSVFHYQSLHKSEYFMNKHDGRCLIESDRYTDCLLRLPLYYDLRDDDVQKICGIIIKTIK